MLLHLRELDLASRGFRPGWSPALASTRRLNDSKAELCIASSPDLGPGQPWLHSQFCAAIEGAADDMCTSMYNACS